MCSLRPLLAALLLPLLGFQTVSADNSLEQRLQLLEQRFEQARISHHIPGLALVVVKDGKTILARGFGQRDLMTQAPVDTDTLFPIHSTTKAFTATLAAQRVWEGALAWDTGISSQLPHTPFFNNAPGNALTLRDLLSHRTGYAQNDALWTHAPDLSREAILSALEGIEPASARGAAYHYNNVMYLAAGLASAHDHPAGWDALLHETLLEPLDMQASTLSFADAQANPKLARGYYWQAAEDTYHLLPHRNVQNVAPATGLYSTAADMAHWLTCLLSNGQFEGRVVVAPQALADTFTPTTQVSPDFEYGLGWHVSTLDGQTLVEHSGNGLGHAAKVVLLPDAGLGYALLMNVSISPLQEASIRLVFDTLLKEGLDTDAVDEPQDYREYLGEYIAEFDPFDYAVFRFLLHGDRPALDIPGQTMYALKDEDETGRLIFEVADSVGVSFQREANGRVVGMTLHEGADEFYLPRRDPSPHADTRDGTTPVLPDAIASLMNLDAQKKQLAAIGDIELNGTLIQVESGIRGRFRYRFNSDVGFELQRDFGQHGLTTQRAVPGGGVSATNPSYFRNPMRGSFLIQAQREHPLNPLMWQDLYQQGAIRSRDEDTLKVALEGFDLPTVNAQVDAKTGQLLALQTYFVDAIWGRYERSIAYEDYRSIAGVAIPHRMTIEDHEIGTTHYVVEDVRCGVSHCTPRAPE